MVQQLFQVSKFLLLCTYSTFNIFYTLVHDARYNWDRAYDFSPPVRNTEQEIQGDWEMDDIDEPADSPDLDYGVNYQRRRPRRNQMDADIDLDLQSMDSAERRFVAFSIYINFEKLTSCLHFSRNNRHRRSPYHLLNAGYGSVSITLQSQSSEGSSRVSFIFNVVLPLHIIELYLYHLL